MILKDKNSSKIIRSASGEILKTPPIIDISSDYEVTKDVSNLVSKVKNRFQPNVFIGVSDPIENGDGFEFDGTNYLKSRAYDFTKSFILETWVKVNSITSNYIISAQRQGNAAGSHFQLYTVAGALSVDGSMWSGGYSLSGLTQFQFVAGVYAHVFLVRNNVSGVISVYGNGYPSSAFAGSVPLPYDNTLPHGIGARVGGSAILNGAVRKYKIHLKQTSQFDNYAGGTSPKWLSNEQVFTPPTYPNTLL